MKFARDGHHFHHHGDAPDDADALVWETEAADYYKAAAERDTAKVTYEIDHCSRKIGVKLMPGSIEEKIVARAISLELARQCENEAIISRAASTGSQFGTGQPSVSAGAIEEGYLLERGSGAIVEPSKETAAGKKIEPVDDFLIWPGV